MLMVSWLAIGPFHADVSVRACTSCRPFVITSKQRGVVTELLDTVAKHRFVQKISVLSNGDLSSVKAAELVNYIVLASVYTYEQFVSYRSITGHG